MIVLAQTSIEEYFPSVTGSINKLIASNSGYVEKIIQLQEELKQKNEEIKRLTLIQKAAAKSTDPAPPKKVSQRQCLKSLLKRNKVME